jgi:nucleoside-diphosphate-sugar epimerase
VIYDEKGDSIPLTNHIQRIYESQLTSHFFPGDVTHGNPYLHLDDLVDAIVDAVERRDELPPEITINLGEDETLSFMELQQTFAKLIHKRAWNTYKIPKSLAKVGSWIQNIFMDPFIKPWMIDMSDDHMELDISKAKNVLGWEPKHTLRETIPRMIDALKTDPKKWYHENKLK